MNTLCCLHDWFLHVQPDSGLTFLCCTHVWMLASACICNTNSKAKNITLNVNSDDQFSLILLGNTLQMDESAGAPSGPPKEKKNILRLSLNTNTLKTPTCTRDCPTLTSASIQAPLTPRNSCVLHSSSRSPWKMPEIAYCWFKEPRSWFSLGAIKKRTAMEQTEEREREAGGDTQLTSGSVLCLLLMGYRASIKEVIDTRTTWLWFDRSQMCMSRTSAGIGCRKQGSVWKIFVAGLLLPVRI